MPAAPRSVPRSGRTPLELLGALGPLLALLAACAFFATQSDRFLTGGNLSLVLQQVMVVGVIAIGQTLVILTAGIDLSCGMVMALAGMVMTRLAVEQALPVPVATSSLSTPAAGVPAMSDTPVSV